MNRHDNRTASPLCVTLMCLVILSGASAGEGLHSTSRHSPSVSPLDELEILDPHVDSEGKPRSQIVVGADGVRRISIAPTVIVHRFYYTGDRDFQGPMLQGGPVLLTVTDPATGEQIYVETSLPPGAPRIKYRRNRIVYQYPDMSVIVCFGFPGPLGLGTIGKPAVTIARHAHKSAEDRLRAEARQKHSSDWWNRTGITECSTETWQATKGLADNSADAIKKVGSIPMAPLKAVWHATPLSSLTSSQQKQPAFESTTPR